MMCECPEANSLCCNGQGYAVYRMTLPDGRRLSLCTRCDLSIYSDKVTLTDIDMEQAWESDPLGALVLAMQEKAG